MPRSAIIDETRYGTIYALAQFSLYLPIGHLRSYLPKADYGDER